MTSLPPPSLAADRATLRAYFEETWALCEWLFSAVDERALYSQPDPLRHPLIFYLGHPAAFYINKLRLAGLLDAPVDAALEALFAKGVDPHGADDLDAIAGWPPVAVVRAYRARVADVVRRVIDTAPLPPFVTWDHPLWALHMGLEHDRIHFETIARCSSGSSGEAVRGWTTGATPTGGPAPALRFEACPPDRDAGSPARLGNPRLGQ
ncbi:MAG: DinB family protein [bacterium]